MQIGTVLAWDFCAVCTTVQIGGGGGTVHNRDRISLGLLRGLHKGGVLCR